ncbi:Serpin domain containing protein [Asbolus verrucosus]|uniref:Serpin domain containing protein n=1 Tax=Asbolus verrucosus TaxID=1661398 RepID=A0A482VV02_ASBVE|nr:Serpin domain containing protein [Asbolus verrucosus]
MADSVTSALQILHGNTVFANSVYQILSKKKGNVFFSPISIHAVLSMAHQGARENTAKILSDTLKIPDAKTTAMGYKSILEHLNSIEDVILLMAYKIYAKKGQDDETTFIEEFEKSVKENFYADVDFVDFSRKNEAVKKINGWVEEKTQEKIRGIVDEELLDEETALLLINAIYFKGEWLGQFKESDTRNQTFYMDSENTLEVRMMKREGKCAYKYDDRLNAEILQLPYKGNNIKMIIILPSERNGIKDLELKLASSDINELADNFATYEVSVSIPKFKMEQTMDLDTVMTEIGLKNIFDEDKANFEGILKLEPNENLCVGKIIQKAYLEVNEKGTEAAAATGNLSLIPYVPENIPNLLKIKGPLFENRL